ncbi:MAG: PIG-L deacetylase family protein [Thermodesulfobacteriota bacterium]
MTELFRKCMVIVPHCDDECISVAGTIAKIKEVGGEVSVIVLVAGDIFFCHAEEKVTAETRIREFENAMKYLGVDYYDVLYRTGDLESRLDTIPIRDIVHRIDRLIVEHQASTVFIPRKSFHQDHIVAHQAAFAACRPSPDKATPRYVLEHEYPASTWNLSGEDSWANFFVDIEDYIEKKVKAIEYHQSQLRSNLHTISIETCVLWAKTRGRIVGIEYAEAFRLLRYVG